MEVLSVLSGPLVFDTHEMGRKPGAERTLETTVEAPADMGYDVFGVPEGSTIDIELRLEAIMEGILATGSASVQAVGECVRCLDPIDRRVTVGFQELYLFDAPSTTEETDEEEYVLEDELLDLEPVLRDAVVLALPHNPLCGPDCPGLCPTCGARLADDPDHTHGEAIDPRWATLSQLAEQPVPSADQSESGTAPDDSKE
ncbi:MAG: metal-binding protein [Aeromicrobium sp.]|nr:metal-binding protein [Aeromicrobium sp.]